MKGRADLSIRGAAAELGLHPETVRILTRSGAFPNSYKTGKGGRTSPTRIPYKDVEDFRAKQPRVNR